MDTNEAKQRAAAWWGGLRKPRKIMVAATALLFVSQFLPYGEAKRFFLYDTTNTSRYTGMASYEEMTTGWNLHPLAGPILIALAIVFGTSLGERPELRRWVYWVAPVLVFLAVVPAAPVRAIGGAIGFAALGLAVWATVVARRSPAP